MNILYDHQVFATQRYGGVSRIFYELINRMVEKKDVQLYLFHGYYINDFPLGDLKGRVSFYFGKRAVNFPYIPVLLKPFNHMIFHTFLSGKPIDLYHPTNYSTTVYNWRKSPLVLTVNDMIPELFPGNFRDIRWRLKSKKKCIERADQIITISHLTRQDLLNYYQVKKEKIKVIYPGAPQAILQNDRDQPRFQHGKPFILYVGTRKQGYKNFKNLLLAYGTSKRINQEFDLICFGSHPFNKSEKQLMAQLGCLDSVLQITGSDRLLAGLYTTTSAFIYPSLYEGFGLPPLEAMAYGCPVIAGAVGAIPEVLGEAAEYFDPGEPESIAAAMESILYNPHRKQEIVKKGKQQVKKYAWKKMADETYRVYKELAG
ncbi:MAG: glycosyltransferase family 1 protein [Candidatus Aminicenantes bacterium]|jgi:glycosyltransferase involved in cell wall biosynthesis